MKYIFYALLSISLFSTTGYAGDDNNSDDTPKSSEQDTTDKPADSGEFIPTEEISEDLPVSFPVDI